MKEVKYAILVQFIFIAAIVDIILFAYPADIARDRSTILSVPLAFWLLLLPFSAFLVLSAIHIRSRLYAILSAVSYFFLIYSFNLFYRIVPEQSDIGATSMFMGFISDNVFIDPQAHIYFNCPVFFTSSKTIMGLMALNGYETVNVGFFLILLSIPLILPITMVKWSRENHATFLIYPAAYILFSFFFINSQFVPQFLGLVFLIATIGCYSQLKETGNVRFYYLTILFFVLCVWTHPFMFVFFLVGLSIGKLWDLRNNEALRRVRDLFKESERAIAFLSGIGDLFGSALLDAREIVHEKAGSYSGRTGKRGVSLSLLALIYSFGYVTAFHRFNIVTTIINPEGTKGETWFIISYLMKSKQKAGISSFPTFPLFDLVPKEEYLLVRYACIAVLFVLGAILIVSVLFVSRKVFNAMDLHLFVGSASVLIAGFAVPGIMGQRAVQVMFVGLPQYAGRTFFRSLLMPILAGALIAGPFFFPISFAISSSLEGFNFLEDDSTLLPGEYISEYGTGNETVFTGDRSYQPVPTIDMHDPTKIERQVPGSLAQYGTGVDADLVIYNDKVWALVNYYGLDPDIFGNYTGIVYDQGSGKVLA